MPCLSGSVSSLNLKETPLSVFLLKESEEMALSGLKPPFLCPLNLLVPLPLKILNFSVSPPRKKENGISYWFISTIPMMSSSPYSLPSPWHRDRRGWGGRRYLRIWRNSERRAGELFSVLNTVLYWHSLWGVAVIQSVQALHWWPYLSH